MSLNTKLLFHKKKPLCFILFSILGCHFDADIQKNYSISSIQNCHQYKNTEIFSYCVYQHAESMSMEEVKTLCPLSEKWEEACRHAWVRKAIRNHYSTDFSILMESCDGFSDCALEILDSLPAKDPREQVRRCKQYVVDDLQDCLNHAMQMWTNSHPTKEETRHVLNSDPYLFDIEIQFIAEYAYCQKWDICTENTKYHKKCRQDIQMMKQNPQPCRLAWGKMPPP